jgi:hypothetical protein
MERVVPTPDARLRGVPSEGPSGLSVKRLHTFRALVAYGQAYPQPNLLRPVGKINRPNSLTYPHPPICVWHAWSCKRARSRPAAQLGCARNTRERRCPVRNENRSTRMAEPATVCVKTRCSGGSCRGALPRPGRHGQSGTYESTICPPKGGRYNKQNRVSLPQGPATEARGRRRLPKLAGLRLLKGSETPHPLINLKLTKPRGLLESTKRPRKWKRTKPTQAGAAGHDISYISGLEVKRTRFLVYRPTVVKAGPHDSHAGHIRLWPPAQRHLSPFGRCPAVSRAKCRRQAARRPSHHLP